MVVSDHMEANENLQWSTARTFDFALFHFSLSKGVCYDERRLTFAFAGLKAR